MDSHEEDNGQELLRTKNHWVMLDNDIAITCCYVLQDHCARYCRCSGRFESLINYCDHSGLALNCWQPKLSNNSLYDLTKLICWSLCADLLTRCRFADWASPQHWTDSRMAGMGNRFVVACYRFEPYLMAFWSNVLSPRPATLFADMLGKPRSQHSRWFHRPLLCQLRCNLDDTCNISGLT